METVVSLPIKRIGFNWWTVKMFIWGGNDYIMDAEENTYEEVLYLVAVVTYQRRRDFTSAMSKK